MEESAKLDYTIHEYSSYSANYVPENILVQSPHEQNSRWFTDAATTPQFVVLKLCTPAIVTSITFGKSNKILPWKKVPAAEAEVEARRPPQAMRVQVHVSNLKQFQILGGTQCSNLTSLLTAGLKNDTTPETFQLRHTTVEGLEVPINYLKIVPLQSFGPAYNYTIWFVELRGINDAKRVQSALYTISLRREEEAVRILLKQLRRRHYSEAFEALSRETGVRLEGPLQARLWNALVESADYDAAETIIDEAVQDGEFDWYISWQPYTATWEQLCGCSGGAESETEAECGQRWAAAGGGAPERAAAAVADETRLPPAAPLVGSDVTCSDREWVQSEGAWNASESCDSCDSVKSEECSCRPGPRGGHQLVVDSTTSCLYLFGGWDGTVDLDDLWLYNIASGRWTLLCAHSARLGGPSPRSCHKMVLDPLRQRIYTLGRYLDHAIRVPDNMKGDLYMFDIMRCEWSLICADTAAVGGPSLVFDHQMCIDADTQTIYVFGGRVLPTSAEEAIRYSGLYAYYVSTDTWQLLLAEHDEPHAPRPRVGHSMLFHPLQRRLYIFAGQRNRDHLLDLWWWDVETRQCGALAGARAAPRPPAAAGFTQRATLDPHTDEIFVLSGLSKEKDKRVCNALWVYSLRRGTWTCAYRTERASAADPPPRFAHQLVYDVNEKVHYLFGGNPGVTGRPRARLHDLWRLRLARPAARAAAAAARAALRAARYTELAARAHAAPPPDLRPALTALAYLRDRLHDTIDTNDPKQLEHFHRLPTALFAGVPPPDSLSPSLTPALTRRLARRRARASPRAAADLSRALAAVLGAEGASPDRPQPFDDWREPEPEHERDAPADVRDLSDDEAEGEAEAEAGAGGELRAARVRLYDHLSQYFRPSLVPPRADVSDLVKF